MILAVLLIMTDSEVCVSAQAHFPFRCNDLKLFDASSVLAMDEKQSLALSNCRLKKEDWLGLGADLGRRPGRDREPHDRTVRPGIQAFAWHAGGTPKQKQGTETKNEKGFPNYIHMLQVYAWDSVMCDLLEVWFNFSPNRMDPDFVKRLFRRTRDSRCESSHNFFPSWNFPKLQQPGKQQKDDSLISIDWRQAFYKERKFLSIFFSHSRCSSAGTSPPSQCTELELLHGTHRPVHASRSCCRPVISTWQALKIRARDRGEHAREVRSSRIVSGASVAQRREYQHFLGALGREKVQKTFSFSVMLFTKHWKQIPKKTVFKKTKTKTIKFCYELCRKWLGVNGMTLRNTQSATLRSPWRQFAMGLLQSTNQCPLHTLYWFVLCNLQIFSGGVCNLEQLFFFASIYFTRMAR